MTARISASTQSEMNDLLEQETAEDRLEMIGRMQHWLEIRADEEWLLEMAHRDRMWSEQLADELAEED